MEDKKTFYITTPIYYPSDKLHIGHSYCSVACDAMARYKRLRGYDVMFLTGTDEHGQKIERKAQEKGVTPQEYVDEIVAGIKKLWKLMDITNDDFLRTTEERHKKIVQKIFKKLYDQGDIYKGEYEGWYCTPCESFWTETQLADGKCPDCNRDVELVKEESYFFKMSRYANRLIKHIEDNPEFIQPVSRANEMINNFLKPGLEDLCVSRTSFKWGIPVDFDDKHVIYVWLDALSNYITALGYMTENNEKFKKYWPANFHVVGKEIIRFHTITWPIMLMALGLELPNQVFGHGWLVIDGGKMSKSKGNVVDPVILIEKYGLDAVRYYLLREVPFGSDGNYSEELLVNRMNSDLANDLGNLVSRTTAMIEKYFDGILPADGTKGEFDDDLKAIVLGTVEKVEEHMEKMHSHLALTEIWKTISRVNKYIDETTPWSLGKDSANKSRLGTVMYNLAEGVRIISILIRPFLTKTPAKIWEQFGITEGVLTDWDSAKQWGILKEGTRVKKAEAIFPRIEIKEEPVKAAQPKVEEPAQKEEYITIDDFAKIDLRIAKVLRAEKVEGADKLLKLTVDAGDGERTVVSGIAKHYLAEDMVGKNVILVANLKPVKLRGIESHGMILAASNEEKLVLACTDKEIERGARVK
ncbi:MAG: methionine--tRNA ligase [Deltaproteobacteria bacterium]